MYAIGSPLGLSDSISGGPLVLTHGRVVGINTMKAITEKFEGIGYAIPIETAVQEFAREWPRAED